MAASSFLVEDKRPDPLYLSSRTAIFNTVVPVPPSLVRCLLKLHLNVYCIVSFKLMFGNYGLDKGKRSVISAHKGVKSGEKVHLMTQFEYFSQPLRW